MPPKGTAAKAKAKAASTPTRAEPPAEPPAEEEEPPAGQPGSPASRSSTEQQVAMTQDELPLVTPKQEAAASKMGRPTTGLTRSDQKRFAAWANRASPNGLKTMSKEQKNELRRVWTLDPSKASNLLVTSTEESQTHTVHESDEWLTRAQIAQRECVSPDSDYLKALLAALPQRCSRFPHMSGYVEANEYNWAAGRKTERASAVVVATTANSQASCCHEEALEVEGCMLASAGSAVQPSAQPKAKSQPKKRKADKLCDNPELSEAVKSSKLLEKAFVQQVKETTQALTTWESTKTLYPWAEPLAKQVEQGLTPFQDLRAFKLTAIILSTLNLYHIIKNQNFRIFFRISESSDF